MLSPNTNTPAGKILEPIEEKSKIKQKKKKTKKKKSIDNENDDNDDETEEKTKEHPIMKDLIADYYLLLTEIGKGAFGQIYLSYYTQKGHEVAIKKEMKRAQKYPQLRTEAKVYQSLLGISLGQDITGTKALSQEEVQGVPKFYGMGELSDCYYLIMEFLGPNLNDLLNYCATKKFTIGTVCLIALQIINRIENMHKHHYLHRDIKPENFLIGIDDKTNIIYLADFGLAKRYKNSKNHQHIPYKEGRTLIGTARYVSINTHLGIEQSRRDDLESIGYVLVYFLKGNLPWQGLKGEHDKYAKIMDKKLQIPTEILCYGLPLEITHYLNYVKSLRFEDRPDYEYLRSLFIKLLGTCAVMYKMEKDNIKFDWCFDDPMNSIWPVYTINKKTKKETSLIQPTPNERISRNLVADQDNKTNLSPIDEKNNQKSNDNNHSISSKNDSNSSSQKKNSSDSGSSHSSKSSQKDKESDKEKESENSDATVKVVFNGVSNMDLIKEQITEDILNSGKPEKIDSFIDAIIHKNKPSQKNKGEKSNKADLKGSVIGMNNKEKLKDSLDIVPSDMKSNRSHLDSPERKRLNNLIIKKKYDDDDDDKPSAELVRNTMRNSKILTPEEMEKILNQRKGSQFISVNKKNKDQIDAVGKLKVVKKDSTKLIKGKKQDKDSNDSNSDSSNSHSSSYSEEKRGRKDSLDLKQKKKVINENSLFENIVASTIKDNINQSLIENKSSLKIPEPIKPQGSNRATPTPVGTNRTTASRLQVNQDSNSKPKDITGRSFEAEIIPKISNPEIKERRKSKILEISNLPQMQNVKLSKEAIIKISDDPINQHYIIIGDLGDGAYGKVKRVQHKKLGEERAMKIINKVGETPQNEVDLLRKICHPNIINVFEIFQDKKKFYIMSELLEGGELFQAIADIGVFSEGDACRIMKQILNAVNYLHNKKIVHRDLKPENIMLTSKMGVGGKNKFETKIIDFGTAKHFEPHQKLNKFIGTSYYIAPEVLKECYDEKCDVWSCGVIMYILLCGYPPFNGSSNVDIYHAIANNPPYFAGEEWKDITKEAIDLLKAMLNKVPLKRYSAEMCLNHKWFKLLDEEEKNNDKRGMKHFQKIQMKVINKMTEFVKENRFKQAVLQFISTQFNLKKEEADLRILFKQFDKDNKGQITKDIFYQMLSELHGDNDGKAICDNIFSHLDLDGSGEISYDEFLTVMIDQSKVITGDRLEKAFKMFDKDGNGKLSIDEIISVFGGSEEHWKKVIDEVDLNKDGEVDFDEFKIMMNNFDDKMVKK